MLGRVKKPPKLNDMLSPAPVKVKRMAWQNMLKVAEAIAGRAG